MNILNKIKWNVKVNPISIGILMIIYTGIVFFSTMLVYWLTLLFSIILLIAINKEKLASFVLTYACLLGLVIFISKKCEISGWIGSIYTMALIIIKLYPLWILAGILSNFGTSTMIYSLKRLHLPNYICIGVAIFFRFIPEYKEYLSEIKEGIKVRNIKLSVLKPINSLELYLVPMIYKAFETGEILACALITKGFEYDCEKTPYEDLSLRTNDYIIIIVGLLIAGITIWEKA